MAQTKWQREAKAMIETVERKGGATIKTTKENSPKRKTWRTRAYKRVARKHPIVAVPVWLFVAVATLIGKSVKWSGIGTGRGTRSASRVISQRLTARVNADLHRRKWTTEAEPVDGKRPREHYQCCGTSYHDVQTLNTHQLAHRGEARAATPATPRLQVGATASTTGKVLVLPAESGGGRHRASHKLPGARNVNDLVTHYREHLNTIGASIMAVNSTTRRLRQAAAAFGTETPRPTDLGELRAICVGFEHAMGALNEAIGEFGVMLKRPKNRDGSGGANIAAELVNPFMGRAREYADDCGREFTKFISAFEVYYGVAIRLAANGTPIPNMDLSKTG